MGFNSESIDFVKTYDNFAKKHGRQRVTRKSFAAPLIRMADAVIKPYFDTDSVKGVKMCLEYEIRHLKWRDYIGFIPLQERSVFSSFLNSTDHANISLLADSTILTIVAYRTQLDERGTGLANIVFNEAISGFEWVCEWLRRGIAIRPLENDLIATLDIDHLMQFIPDR